MKKIRSAKGQIVDFDLMKIKESLGSEPAPTDVAARQNHIDSRLRRRMRNMKKTPVPTTPVQAPKQPVEVAPTLPPVNESEVEFIDTPVEAEKSKPTKKPTQQKARRTTKTDDSSDK